MTGDIWKFLKRDPVSMSLLFISALLVASILCVGIKIQLHGYPEDRLPPKLISEKDGVRLWVVYYNGAPVYFTTPPGRVTWEKREPNGMRRPRVTLPADE